MAWLIPSWRGGLAPRTGALPPEVLARTSALAEELVGDFFNLGPRDWKGLQYQVFRSREAGEALATLALFETPALLPYRRRWFYGIFLAEDRLLSLAWGPSLEALLLYIFTHELVHMVRFLKFRANFWMPYPLRFKEEKEVHRLTRSILKRLTFKEISEILRRFDEIYAQEV